LGFGGDVVVFEEATKERRKSFNAVRRRLIARESSSCNFYMRNKEE
jgi:hypothetical protein